MDAATTKGVIERLLRKGYVRSVPSGNDRRRLEISLTSEGTTATHEATAIAQGISARTARNLTERELQRLLTLLDKL